MPTFSTPEPISVVIELLVADVRIVASERTDTIVDVQPSDPAKPADVSAAEQTSAHYADGVLEVSGSKRWNRPSFRGGSQSVEVRIEVPAGSRVRGEAGVLALRCAGTLGECHFKAGVGDLTIEHVAGDAQLTTGTGDVRVERIDGSAAVRNSNGDTWIGDVSGDLQVKSANGKIGVDRAHAAVSVKTANGDIQLGEVARGVTIAETACGKVDVAVRAGVAAWLELHTGFGHVHNLLSTGERPQPSEDTMKVRARTTFGDVTVRRADAESAEAAVKEQTTPVTTGEGSSVTTRRR